jgi:hypothetical protein
MAPKLTQSRVDAAVRQLRTASNDLRWYGQQLEAARRELDRGNRRAQSRLRPLQRSQPQLSVSEQRFLQSVRGHVASDPLNRPHDVFLSHATADLGLARDLQDELETLGAEVWMDDFQAGPELRSGHRLRRRLIPGGRRPSDPGRPCWPLLGREGVLALLNSKDTVIPVLHEVTWAELAAYSPLLHLTRVLRPRTGQSPRSLPTRRRSSARQREFRRHHPGRAGEEYRADDCQHRELRTEL